MSKLQDTIMSVRDLYRQGLSVNEIAHYLSLNPDFVKEQIKPLLNEDVAYDDYDATDY